MRTIIGTTIAMIILAACSQDPQQSTAPIGQAHPDLAGEPFDQVLLRVKQEVGLFQSRSAAWHKDIAEELKQDGITPRCGSGDINFSISTVKMAFATVLDHKTTGEVGLKIPFGPVGAGNVGPDVKGSVEDKATSTLDYTYYVPSLPGAVDETASRVIAASAVIAPTLAALRKGLVEATAQLPCMRDTPAGKDDSFTFAVELTRDANPNIGFNFYLVSASAASDTSRSRTDTITVTFHPTPTGSHLFAE